MGQNSGKLQGDTPMLPFISIVVPVPPGTSVRGVAHSLRELDYPKDKYEIAVTVGKNPSSQRNVAVLNSNGAIIYFLDDDSRPRNNVLRRLVTWFRDPDVIAVGGPTVTPEDNSILQQCFGYALGSSFGAWNMKGRHKPIGGARLSGERDLILANLAIRREPFLEERGFDRRLYPNEENEFLNRLSLRGGKIVYDPELIVLRDQRSSLGGFAQQLFRYGRGRMEHMLIAPHFASAIFLAPPMFCLYLGTLVFLHNLLYLAPLIVYLILSLVFTLAIAVRHGKPSAMRLMIIFPLMHIAYGLGMFVGVASGMRKRRQKLKLETPLGRKTGEVTTYRILVGASDEIIP